MSEQSTKYKLEERTAVFGEAAIDLCKQIPRSVVNDQIVRQLVRSSTSIGANYAEANNASSRRDFRNKIYISKKEAQEPLHWLRMLSRVAAEHKDSIEHLRGECSELLLIFSKATKTLDGKKE